MIVTIKKIEATLIGWREYVDQFDPEDYTAEKMTKENEKEVGIIAALNHPNIFVLKLYTQELLGRDFTWKEFHQYLSSNIENEFLLSMILAMSDEKTRNNLYIELLKKK